MREFTAKEVCEWWGGGARNPKFLVVSSKGCPKCMSFKQRFDEVVGDRVDHSEFAFYTHLGDGDTAKVLEGTKVMSVPAIVYSKGSYHWTEDFEIQNWLEAMRDGDRSFFEDGDSELSWIDDFYGKNDQDETFRKAMEN